jgi:hypothetical protein
MSEFNNSTNSIIDKLRDQWSQYNFSSFRQQQKQARRKRKHTSQKQETKRDFHYKCPHCSEPIFYNQYWFDDFQNRYIPLSAYTHRPHKCYQKEAERKQGLMNGICLILLANI